MNQSELEQNIFWACLKYAHDNGGITDWTTFFPEHFQLSGYNIYRWTHSSTQPTNADLLAYNVSDLDEVKLIWSCIEKIKQGKTCGCSTAIGNIIKDYADEGQLRYCSTDQVLKIMLNGQWVALL